MAHYIVLLALVLNPLLALQNHILNDVVPSSKTTNEKKITLPSKSDIIGKKTKQGCHLTLFNAFGFIFPCGPDNSACSPVPCSTCVDQAILFPLDCGSCCITSVTISSTNGTCFSCCGVIQHPQQQTWTPSRTNCNSTSMTLTPNSSSDYWCSGETLMFQFCSNNTSSPAGITFTAHTDNCGDLVLTF